eukprot:g69090.t1
MVSPASFNDIVFICSGQVSCLDIRPWEDCGTVQDLFESSFRGANINIASRTNDIGPFSYWCGCSRNDYLPYYSEPNARSCLFSSWANTKAGQYLGVCSDARGGFDTNRYDMTNCRGPKQEDECLVQCQPGRFFEPTWICPLLQQFPYRLQYESLMMVPGADMQWYQPQLALGDLDGDGLDDIVLTCAANATCELLNTWPRCRCAGGLVGDGVRFCVPRPPLRSGGSGLYVLRLGNQSVATDTMDRIVPGQCVTYCGAGSALQALSVTTVWSEADCELSLFHEQRFRCGTTDLVCEPLAMVAAQVSRQMLDALKVDMVLNERVTDDYLLCHNAAPAAAARVLCPVARQTLGLTDDRCGALAYACAAGGGTIECDGGWTRDPTVDPFCTTPQSDGLSPVPCDCGVHWTPVVQALAPSALIDSQCYLDMQSGGLSKANLDAFRLCTSNAPAGGMSCAARGLVSLDELVLLWLADDVPEAASRGLLLEHSLRGTDPRASVDSPAAVLLLLRRLLAADGGGDRILLGEVLATNRDRRAWCLGADDTGAAAPVCALRPGLGLPLCTVHCPVGTVASVANRAVRCCNSRGCCWLGTAGLTYSANETKLQRLPVGNDTVCRPNLFPELTAYPRPTATAVLAPSDAQRQLCFEDVRCQAIVLFANGGVFFSERELNFPLAELRRLDPGRLHQLDEDKQSTRYLHPVPERELAARGDTVVTSLQSAVVGLDRRDQMAIIQRALLRVDLVREVVRDALVLRNIFEARRATGAAEAVTAAAPVALPEGCGAGRGPCVSGGAWPGAAAELALLAQAQDDLRAGRLRSSEADRFRAGDHAVAVAEARSHTLLRYFVPAWSGAAFSSAGVAGRCEYDAPWGEKVDLTGHEPLPSRCETLSMTWPWQFAAYWNWRNWVALDAFSHGATRWSAGAGNCSSLSFPLWRNEPVLVDGRWQGCFEPRCPQPVPYDYDWYARSTVSWSVPDTTVAPRDATVAPCGWDRGICGSNGRCQCNSGFRVKPNTDPTTLVYDAAGEPRVARVLQQDACDIDGRGVCKSKLSYGSGEDCSGRGVCVADFRADERAATCRCGDQKFPWACACQTGAFETDSGLCKAKVVALVDEYGTPPQ